MRGRARPVFFLKNRTFSTDGALAPVRRAPPRPAACVAADLPLPLGGASCTGGQNQRTWRGGVNVRHGNGVGFGSRGRERGGNDQQRQLCDSTRPAGRSRSRHVFGNLEDK